MNTNHFTLTGNLTADPEVRFTPSGAGVASFTIAHTERKLDKDSNQWVDGDTLFMRCSVWRKQAEHFADSAGKGDPVMVTGRLKQRSYETKEGEKRTVVELEAETVALMVTRGAVRPVRAGGQGGSPQLVGAAAGSGSGLDDLWATGPSPF
jgi:single-strand DNA-binding protein